jgi:hypothetical protein
MGFSHCHNINFCEVCILNFHNYSFLRKKKGWEIFLWDLERPCSWHLLHIQKVPKGYYFSRSKSVCATKGHLVHQKIKERNEFSVIFSPSTLLFSPSSGRENLNNFIFIPLLFLFYNSNSSIKK